MKAIIRHVKEDRDVDMIYLSTNLSFIGALTTEIYERKCMLFGFVMTGSCLEFKVTLMRMCNTHIQFAHDAFLN